MFLIYIYKQILFPQVPFYPFIPWYTRYKIFDSINYQEDITKPLQFTTSLSTSNAILTQNTLNIIISLHLQNLGSFHHFWTAYNTKQRINKNWTAYIKSGHPLNWTTFTIWITYKTGQHIKTGQHAKLSKLSKLNSILNWTASINLDSFKASKTGQL